jgi:hypothetical protein
MGVELGLSHYGTRVLENWVLRRIFGHRRTEGGSNSELEKTA